MHADEEQEVYTDAPDGWRRSGMCWRLLKNINRRRTGAKGWFDYVAKSMSKCGLEQLKTDAATYVHREKQVYICGAC